LLANCFAVWYLAKMPIWFQQMPLQDAHFSGMREMAAENSYRVVNPSDIPGVPTGLARRCDAAVVMRSGSLEQEYVVVNLFRRDGNNYDQMPLGTLLVSGSGVAAILTHHGDWDDRTFPVSPTAPSYSLSPASSSIYTSSFATIGLPSQESGSILALTSQTNLDAFNRVVAEIENPTAATHTLPASPPVPPEITFEI
jgi:hypothetical protein